MASNPIALARAFTKRTKRPEVASLPTREGSVRYAPGTIRRAQISLPTELLSTTNVHALNAPDIRQVSASSSNSSLRSSDDSDFASISKTFLESPMTTPDTSMENSPVSAEHTHQASFFESKSPKRSVTSAGTTRSVSSSSSVDAPTLPQRAMSHSKRAHQDLARKRSISGMSPPPTAISGVDVARDSTAFFTGAIESSHPFGNELAKVNEVAEEFGAVSAVLEEEEQYLISRGLHKFSAEDYINEIYGLSGGVYEGRLANAWI